MEYKLNLPTTLSSKRYRLDSEGKFTALNQSVAKHDSKGYFLSLSSVWSLYLDPI